MRVLLVAHGIPPLAVGGTEQVLLELAESLLESASPDASVTLFSPLDAHFRPGTRLREQRGRLTVLARAFPTPRSYRETFEHPDVEAGFGELLAEVQPDIVHFHHLSGLSMGLPALCRSFGAIPLLTLHDFWLMCGRGQRVNLELERCSGPGQEGCGRCLSDQLALEHPLLRPLRGLVAKVGRQVREGGPLRRILETMNALEGRRYRALLEPGRDGTTRPENPVLSARMTAGRHALRACARVTAPSRAMATAFQIWAPELAPIRVMPNPTPRWKSVPTTTVLPPKPLRVLQLGSIIPTKGPQILLEALRRIPSGQVQVTLAGPMPPFHRAPGFGEDLKASARGLPVTWAGPLAHERIPSLLATHHLLVLPSIWEENAPRVLEEAWQIGIPVVASRVGGIPERVVDGMNGILVSPGDSEALAAVLLELIHTPSRLEQLRQGARATRPLSGGDGADYWNLYREALEAR